MAAADNVNDETDHEHDGTVVVCCTHVLDGTLPILRVSHDSDGDWQAHCAVLEHDDGRIICFQCMVGRDGTIAELASLPLGWGADRDALGEPWVRSANPLADD
jgi:hypothetical protein